MALQLNKLFYTDKIYVSHIKPVYRFPVGNFNGRAFCIPLLQVLHSFSLPLVELSQSNITSQLPAFIKQIFVQERRLLVLHLDSDCFP